MRTHESSRDANRGPVSTATVYINADGGRDFVSFRFIFTALIFFLLSRCTLSTLPCVAVDADPTMQRRTRTTRLV